MLRRIATAAPAAWMLVFVACGGAPASEDAAPPAAAGPPAGEWFVERAKEVGLEFSGHIPADVGLVRAIDRGQKTVDHLDGYIEHLDAKRGPIDPVKLAAIVRKTRETGTWVVPTMVLWETILGSASLQEMAAFPELKYMPRRMVEGGVGGRAQQVRQRDPAQPHPDATEKPPPGMAEDGLRAGTHWICHWIAPQRFVTHSS